MSADFKIPTREQFERVMERLRETLPAVDECAHCGERRAVNADCLCDECARRDAIAGDALADLYNDDEGCAWLYAHHVAGVAEMVSR